MKAILEFDLPEDSSEHEDAINGFRWKMIAWGFDQHLRSKIKYGELPEAEAQTYSEIRTHFSEMILESGLTLEQ